MTEQQPEVRPGVGADVAEENGFADQARTLAGQEPSAASTEDPAQPADESSSPA